VLDVRGDRVLVVDKGLPLDEHPKAFSRADLPLPGLPSKSARTSQDGNNESDDTLGATADFFLPLRLFLGLFESSTWPNRNSSARVSGGDMAEIACQRPIHSKYDNGLEITLVKEPLTVEISTEGNVSPLTIVIPLADNDWDIFKGGEELPGVLLLLSGGVIGEDGMTGRLKHPSNSSCARSGCQGGKAGSETMEKMD